MLSSSIDNETCAEYNCENKGIYYIIVKMQYIGCDNGNRSNCAFNPSFSNNDWFVSIYDGVNGRLLDCVIYKMGRKTINDLIGIYHVMFMVPLVVIL